jgi:hypothetical protein
LPAFSINAAIGPIDIHLTDPLADQWRICYVPLASADFSNWMIFMDLAKPGAAAASAPGLSRPTQDGRSDLILSKDP